ncbi:MAG: HIT family protein [Thermaerobacter sp.]|nr:HIT family protein [Thermaerobacter sp.]
MQPSADCPFCHPERDPDQHVVFETQACRFLQHDREQDVLVGSGVIVPRAHRENAFALTSEEWLDTQLLLQQAKAYIDERFHPAGYTLGWNVGLVSNQTIAHAHLHVLPRYADEPYAGRGLRFWLKSSANRRSSLGV